MVRGVVRGVLAGLVWRARLGDDNLDLFCGGGRSQRALDDFLCYLIGKIVRNFGLCGLCLI